MNWLIFLLIFSFSCGSGKKKVVIDEVEFEVPEPAKPKPNGFVGFDNFESASLGFLTGGVSDVAQENSRFLTLCDQMNAGENIEELKLGVEKSLNQLSTEVEVSPGVWIDECTLRFDLRDYGFDQVNFKGLTKWDLIEAADPLNFESFTDRGILIKGLTKTERPWMHAANFIETSHTGNTYYDILNIPTTLNGLLRSAGCNLQRDFDDFDEDLFMVGQRRSLIALQKNRSILFTECRDGAFSITYDVIKEQVTSAGRNLSINPFPIEARTNNTLQHDANEVIGKLPNGMLFFGLFNALGDRQLFANTNLVADNIRANIDPIITNARSCPACHAKGFIDVDDFIAGHVRGNPNFSAEEIQKASFYFGRSSGLKDAIGRANDGYQRAMDILGVNTSRPDPVNALTDKIRLEMNAKQIASLLFLEEDVFKQQLQQSPGGLLAISQLLDGGSINFQDFIQVAPVLVQDLNLFQEDLGQ